MLMFAKYLVMRKYNNNGKGSCCVTRIHVIDIVMYYIACSVLYAILIQSRTLIVVSFDACMHLMISIVDIDIVVDA